MDDDFLNKFFAELTEEIDNTNYVNALKEQINDLDEEKLETIIKEHF